MKTTYQLIKERVKNLENKNKNLEIMIHTVIEFIRPLIECEDNIINGKVLKQVYIMLNGEENENK